MPPTPIYLLEVVPLDSTGEQVATSLAGRLAAAQTSTAAIQAVTDNLPNGGSLTDITAIKAVTDNLPDDGSLTDLASIKAVTDNLPNSGSLTDLASIKAVTDNLPNAGVLTDISAETDKIDAAASDGLTGTVDSTSYRIHEIERHFHSYERWFGAATAPNGEIHVADRIGTTTTAFQTDAGNLTWGNWLQVLGSSDTPIEVGNTYFDLHRMQVVAVESANATHFIQIAYGATGAAALEAGTYTELAFRPQSVQGAETIINIHTRRVAAEIKTWIRHLAVGQNTSTMDFFIGLHEYEG